MLAFAVRLAPLVCGIMLMFLVSPAQALTKQELKCRDGTQEERLETCSQLIKAGKGDLAAYYNNRALEWADKGECELAIGDFDEAIRITKKKNNKIDLYNYTLRLGIVYFECSIDLPRAAEVATEATKILPKDAAAFGNRGRARSAMGDLDGALDDFATSIRLDPKNHWSYNSRALTLRDKGDLDGAIESANQAIRYNHKSAQYFANRSQFWILKGDLHRALKDASSAVALDADHVLANAMHGDVLRHLGRYDEALAAYRRALDVKSDYTTGYTGLGLTYEKMGNLAEARAAFEKSVEIGRSRKLGDILKSSYETAEARLAAYGAGSPPAPAVTTAAAALPVPVSPPAPIASAPSGKRVALVIGNSAYTKVPALPNPPRDAAAVSAALRQAGFSVVTVANDTDRQTLANALRTFAVEAESADWAMVYYSGHGIEVGGVNYLIPVDAQLAADRDVQFEAVPLDQVLASVEGAKKIKIVVLDACRDNPFAAGMRQTAATRSIGRGLTRVEPEGATLVVYSAKHGQVALDGDGQNSPFALAFLKRLPTPGVEINKLFRLVRDDVMELTKGQQEPFLYGSLPGREDFFFVAAK